MKYIDFKPRIGSSSDTTTSVVNTLQWPRREVINKSSNDDPDYDLVSVPEFGYKAIESVTPDSPVTVGKTL